MMLNRCILILVLNLSGLLGFPAALAQTRTEHVPPIVVTLGAKINGPVPLVAGHDFDVTYTLHDTGLTPNPIAGGVVATYQGNTFGSPDKIVTVSSASPNYSGSLHIVASKGGKSTLTVSFVGPQACTATPGEFGVVHTACTQATLASISLDIYADPNLTGQDMDQDGLDDGLEHALLAHYRPYYKFSKPGVPEKVALGPDYEPFPPIDVADYLRASAVGWVHADWSEFKELLPLNAFQNGQFDALLGLAVTSDDTCTDNMKNCGSDMTVNHRKTRYVIAGVKLPPVNKSDMDNVQAVGNIGLYGHVVPYGQSIKQNDPHKSLASGANGKLIKIEYWQFFRYNGGPAPHGGDWTTVQLLIDMNSGTQPCQGSTQFGQVVAVFHYHHGDESRFDFPQCTGQVSTSESGVNEYTSSNGSRVRMFRDSAGDFSHPVVYIEYATHEFWPTSAGSKAGAPGHPGDGPSFLTAVPPNLGEVEAPLAEYPEAEILMRYNGFWGACCLTNNPPPGPALHTEWTWPANSEVAKVLTGAEN